MNNGKDRDGETWVTESCCGYLRQGYRVEEVLFSGASKYQRIEVVRTAGHGVMLINDGFVMVSERDEFVYHEMIAHVPLFVHPSPSRVLIIGGGDGGTAREVLRHKNVERVVMVEIDALVVEVCRKYLPGLACGLDDPRLELLIEDGVEYVKNTEEKFDLVIVDSTDPIGPATPLFNRSFYEGVAGILDDDGILITQAESPWYDNDIQVSMLANQRPFFDKLHIYLISNLTYPGGLWSFGFASKGPSPLSDFDEERVKKNLIKMRYYNPAIHRAAFALPGFVLENLGNILNCV